LADKMASMWAVWMDERMVDLLAVYLVHCLVAHWVCELAYWLVV